MRLVHSWLEDHKLASSIAVAIQASPILEVKQVFLTTNSWIVNHCKQVAVSRASGSGNPGCTFDVAVHLSTTAMQNVKVDRGTAADVSSICHEFVNGAVVALASVGGTEREPNGHNRTLFMNAALNLCGFVLDLHSRCVFWLGRGEQLQIPPCITEATVQQEGSSVQGIASTSRSALDGHLLLACHRLLLLHSLIHDEERKEMDAPFLERASGELKVEAARLAAWIGNTAKQPSQEGPLRGQRWLAVLPSFNSWIAYANHADTGLFLKWVFSAYVDFRSARSLPTTTTTPPRQYVNDDTGALTLEGEASMALLSDSSFFEHKEVSSRLNIIGLSVAADCLLSALSSFGSSSSLSKPKLLVSILPGDEGWSRSDSPTVHKMVKGCSEIKIRWKD